jgi:hypothetical protein
MRGTKGKRRKTTYFLPDTKTRESFKPQIPCNAPLQWEHKKHKNKKRTRKFIKGEQKTLLITTTSTA